MKKVVLGGALGCIGRACPDIVEECLEKGMVVNFLCKCETWEARSKRRVDYCVSAFKKGL